MAGALHALDLHPTHQGIRYTLHGLFHDAPSAAAAATRLSGRGRTAIEYQLTAPSGRALHAVAGAHGSMPARRARLPHDVSVPWQAVRIALEAFRVAERAAKARGTPLRWYKELEERKLRDCMQAYEWRGTCLDVAGRIVSDTVLVHPFPNANHRTSTALARTFLRSLGVKWPHYNLQGQGIDRFIRDTEPYVIRSKYLLHMIRHQPLFQVAANAGFVSVEVKAGRVVPLDPADLAATEAQLEAKHVASCTHMISSLAGPAPPAALSDPNTKRLRNLVDWYFG